MSSVVPLYLCSSVVVAWYLYYVNKACNINDDQALVSSTNIFCPNMSYLLFRHIPRVMIKEQQILP